MTGTQDPDLTIKAELLGAVTVLSKPLGGGPDRSYTSACMGEMNPDEYTPSGKP